MVSGRPRLCNHVVRYGSNRDEKDGDSPDQSLGTMQRLDLLIEARTGESVRDGLLGRGVSVPDDLLSRLGLR